MRLIAPGSAGAASFRTSGSIGRSCAERGSSSSQPPGSLDRLSVSPDQRRLERKEEGDGKQEIRRQREVDFSPRREWRERAAVREEELVIAPWPPSRAVPVAPVRHAARHEAEEHQVFDLIDSQNHHEIGADEGTDLVLHSAFTPCERPRSGDTEEARSAAVRHPAAW
jgi:hypothetical protein